MSLSLVHQDYQPTESYHLYHGYDVSSYEMKRLDSLQFYFQKNAASHRPHSTKSTDFVFGFTAMKNSGRRSYVYELDEIANRFSSHKIFVRDEVSDNPKNTLIPVAEYMEQVKGAKYTYILPAYDRACFSIFRLIESIQYDCLPLIHQDCDRSEVEQSFDVDLSPLVRSEPMSDADRTEMLDYLKSKMLRVERGFAAK